MIAHLLDKVGKKNPLMTIDSSSNHIGFKSTDEIISNLVHMGRMHILCFHRKGYKCLITRRGSNFGIYCKQKNIKLSLKKVSLKCAK